MATWDDLEAADPDLAAFGRARLYRLGDGIGLLATVRHTDGGPRVHPVCLTMCEGRVYVAIPRGSPKNRDLRADGRYMVHAFPDEQDAEFSLRGTARLVVDAAEREAVAGAAVFATGVRADEDVFALDIARVDATTWEHWNTPHTRPVRRRWMASDD